MITESTYYSLYLIICSILLLTCLPKAVVPSSWGDSLQSISGKTNNVLLIVSLAVVLTVIIGNRPINVGADTSQYHSEYVYASGDFEPKLDNNPIFFSIMHWCGKMNFPISVFFSIIAAIYFVFMGVACIKLFPENSNVAFLSYLVAFSTFSYGVNGIKAGAAASIFLVALAYRNKIWLSILLAAISVGFHHSMVMVVYAYGVSLIYKNIKSYFYLWLFSFAIAAAHIGFFQSLFARYADDSGATYLEAAGGYLTGFRFDFILYSAAPVICGYFAYFKIGIKNEMYQLLLRMYLLTNSVWMLCMYASYTNRIAYLSWFMLPIVLLYPFYGIHSYPTQIETGKKVAIYHLLFTLFMTFIYYKLRFIL